MTKFNPENKDNLTYGECLDPAMKITDKADAMQYLKDYIAFIQKVRDRHDCKDGMTAEQVAKSNLGYYAGYGSMEQRERVEELFECRHPIFGSAKESMPTAKEALELGLWSGKN